jgi:ABC-type transport system involved in multi-copper enzyme maturation permease subunit
VNPEADRSRLQPEWLYVFAGALVVLAVAIVVCLVIAYAVFGHAVGDAMAGM